MKKLMPILILILTACTVYSQPGSKTGKGDTCICITPQEMRNAIQTDDTLQIAKAVVSQQDTVILNMKRLAASADSVIKTQELIGINDGKKITNLMDQSRLLTTVNVLLLDQNNVLKDDKKKLKKKLGWLTGLSTAVISGLVYMLVK